MLRISRKRLVQVFITLTLLALATIPALADPPFGREGAPTGRGGASRNKLYDQIVRVVMFIGNPGTTVPQKSEIQR
jgi:hypothetical protein